MKLSFSRSILAKGQMPMGMKVSRCLLGGAAVRDMPACSLQGGRAHRTRGWAGLVTPSNPQEDAWEDPL